MQQKQQTLSYKNKQYFRLLPQIVLQSSRNTKPLNNYSKKPNKLIKHSILCNIFWSNTSAFHNRSTRDINFTKTNHMLPYCRQYRQQTALTCDHHTVPLTSPMGGPSSTHFQNLSIKGSYTNGKLAFYLQFTFFVSRCQNAASVNLCLACWANLWLWNGIPNFD